MEVKSPEEVCKAVALDLRAQGITHEEAGRRIGKTRNAVSNLLSRKARFSSKTADLFAREFGYNRDFLMYGKGTLRTDEENVVGLNGPEKWDPDPLVLVSMMDICEGILRMTNMKNAKLAWTFFKLGDYDKFREYLTLLHEETGEDITVPESIARIICDRARDTLHSAPLLLSRKEMGLASE